MTETTQLVSESEPKIDAVGASEKTLGRSINQAENTAIGIVGYGISAALIGLAVTSGVRAEIAHLSSNMPDAVSQALLAAGCVAGSANILQTTYNRLKGILKK